MVNIFRAFSDARYHKTKPIYRGGERKKRTSIIKNIRHNNEDEELQFAFLCISSYAAVVFSLILSSHPFHIHWYSLDLSLYISEPLRVDVWPLLTKTKIYCCYCNCLTRASKLSETKNSMRNKKWPANHSTQLGSALCWQLYFQQNFLHNAGWAFFRAVWCVFTHFLCVVDENWVLYGALIYASTRKRASRFHTSRYPLCPKLNALETEIRWIIFSAVMISFFRNENSISLSWQPKTDEISHVCVSNFFPAMKFSIKWKLDET